MMSQGCYFALVSILPAQPSSARNNSSHAVGAAQNDMVAELARNQFERFALDALVITRSGSRGILLVGDEWRTLVPHGFQPIHSRRQRAELKPKFSDGSGFTSFSGRSPRSANEFPVRLRLA